jgi:hypothetical protein
MNMATHDAVQAAPLGIPQARLSIEGDVMLGGVAAPFEELRKRPVAQAHFAAQAVKQHIAGQDAVVKPVAELFLHAAELGLRVVVVAMRD